MKTTHLSLSRCFASAGVLLLASSPTTTAAAAAPQPPPRQASANNAAGHAAADAAVHAHVHLGSFASDLNECSAQASICLGDVECLECMTSFVDHPIEYDQCMGDYDPDWPSATACDVKAAKPCCFDLVSRGNCLESGYFLEYWECWFEEFAECPDHELTCIGTEDTSGSGSGSGSSSSSSSSSSSLTPDVLGETASEGSAAAGMASFRKNAVAVASSLASIVAAGALLLL